MNSRKKIIITYILILIIYLLVEFLVPNSYKHYRYFMVIFAVLMLILTYIQYKDDKKS